MQLKPQCKHLPVHNIQSPSTRMPGHRQSIRVTILQNTATLVEETAATAAAAAITLINKNTNNTYNYT